MLELAVHLNFLIHVAIHFQLIVQLMLLHCPQPEAAQGGLDVQEPGGQRSMQMEPGDPAASTSSAKRKSPCANMPIFRSPLSRMFLSPRMHLSPVVRSPSMRRGISPSATLERSLSPSARSLSPVVARTVTSHDLGQGKI